MAHSMYISSAEGNSGKSSVALGVVESLRRHLPNVGVFRPIVRSRNERDWVLDLLLGSDIAPDEYEASLGVDYDTVHADPDAALLDIVTRFKRIESAYDAVVVVGSDYTDVASPTELSFNARVAANLGVPMLLVLGGRLGQAGDERLGHADPRPVADLAVLTDQAIGQIRHEHATVFGIVVNRADGAAIEHTVASVASAAGSTTPVWVIPEDRTLVAPTMANIMTAVGGTFMAGDEALLSREVFDVVVAGMSLNNVLDRLIDGAVIIIAADRTDVLLGVLSAQAAATFPSVSGVVLNGGFALPDPIRRLMDGLDSDLPIITTPSGTFDTAAAVMHSRGRLSADSQGKRDAAVALFERYVPATELLARLNVGAPEVVTPLMFEYGLLERARADRKRIVLPEGSDDRILRAAATIRSRDVADLIILGDESTIRSRATELGLDLTGVTVTPTKDAEVIERFATEYQRLRAHKGITLEHARDTVTDPSYFATMMVHLGLADGMVSGAIHTTAHTIRPALEFVKTRPGVSVVSSVFLMAMADRVLVYGDCAVNPDPNATQLADIAISSAETAARFGIEPRVAMLSYSTGESGSGADVDKVREATALVRERRPDLAVTGPIQYDAAADPAVAATKMPGDPVAGNATVFIFPDLNTGNNTYKAVQRSAGAVAIGPVLQGLNKPVNDLSRGATVADIVNTIAITAIQAQESQ
ncbi:MAG: phosphate acetyltransferase [Agromyces sp.]